MSIKMFEFKNIENLTIEQLFQELGIADFTYIETSEFLEQLESYRLKVHQSIKEKQHEPSKSLGKDESIG